MLPHGHVFSSIPLRWRPLLSSCGNNKNITPQIPRHSTRLCRCKGLEKRRRSRIHRARLPNSRKQTHAAWVHTVNIAGLNHRSTRWEQIDVHTYVRTRPRLISQHRAVRSPKRRNAAQSGASEGPIRRLTATPEARKVRATRPGHSENFHALS